MIPASDLLTCAAAMQSANRIRAARLMRAAAALRPGVELSREADETVRVIYSNWYDTRKANDHEC